MTNLNPSEKGNKITFVSITRFNLREANRVFEEISEDGFTIVTKNNKPVAVLLKPKRFEEMVGLLEDYALYFEAEKRVRNVGTADLISNKQVLKDLGISESDVEDEDVDIE